jgi:hypothetical protein
MGTSEQNTDGTLTDPYVKLAREETKNKVNGRNFIIKIA